MKEFFKMVFASMLGFLLFILLIGFLGVLSIMGMIASSEATKEVEDKSVMVLNLSGTLNERSENIPGFLSFLNFPESGLGLEEVLDAIREQIRRGRQVYVVYPLIRESEKTDLKNLEEGYEMLRQQFAEYKLSKVHGQMKPKEKDEEMQRFAAGETHILVSTTVIEVGVNVPNASVMVIFEAQRFGLSQLHQLRGRVGRGAEQSYCILVTPPKLSEDTRKRMDIMCQTTDGFEIAEADLKLRGPGDLEGTAQSGMAFTLKIADIARDGQLVQLARDEAQRVIDDDPECQQSRYQLLWNRLRELRQTDINWAAIS